VLSKALQETIDGKKVLVVSSITACLFLLCPNKGHGAGREHERAVGWLLSLSAGSGQLEPLRVRHKAAFQVREMSLSGEH